MPEVSLNPSTHNIPPCSNGIRHWVETRPPRILIVRLSAVGDVIHGVPVLCALREALPTAFLAWVVEGTMGDVLDSHPALDELVRVPRRWWKSPREIWRMRQRLRSFKFDIAIDLQC